MADAVFDDPANDAGTALSHSKGVQRSYHSTHPQEYQFVPTFTRPRSIMRNSSSTTSRSTIPWATLLLLKTPAWAPLQRLTSKLELLFATCTTPHTPGPMRTSRPCIMESQSETGTAQHHLICHPGRFLTLMIENMG